MPALNCWEFMNCCREPGGARAAELGVCPAAIEIRTDNLNNGKNGGRACWAISGTLCGGVVQGTFASKLSNCTNCDFYSEVYYSEGRNIVSTKEILQKLF